MTVESYSPNAVIRFTRDGDIEPSRIVAIRALDTFHHLIGQPVIVRYYTSPAKDQIDCITAVGVKNGIGPDCYQIMSPFNKSIIWGVVSSYEEMDVAKFPTGREVYIFIEPETKEAKYARLNEFHEREFVDITDGPKAYEDLTTGRTIYIASIDGKVSVCSGYSDDDIRRISEGKLDIQQDIEDSNKIVTTDENGKISFTAVDELLSAGENIEINAVNEISAPNVVPQYSTLPPANESNGKVVQYIGQTELHPAEGDPLVTCRFYKSNGEVWREVKVQGSWKNIIPISKEDYLTEELDPDNLYIVKDYLKDTSANIVFTPEVFTDELPEAKESLEGDSFIYTGNSNENYLKGRIYRCEKGDNDEYSWQDVSVGDSYIHSYQTYSNEVPYVNNSIIYVDSFEVIEDMYKRIKKMSSFNGVIELEIDEENKVTLPIIRINGLKDMTDDNPDKHTIYIDFTVIDPTTNLPHRLVINANKQVINNPYKFYLTIVQ